MTISHTPHSGGRGAERFKGGKHGEVSGYVGRIHKRERVGGFVSSVRRVRNWETLADIFISRKSRQNADGPFAFIKYKFHGDECKAIETMNDASWGSAKLFVTMSKFKKDAEGHKKLREKIKGLEPKRRYIQKWVEVKKNKEGENETASDGLLAGGMSETGGAKG
ncbi:hypothetical protein PIB30_063065 [Stylosanthes scabra]|uniref:RRM domain-containing protein n=1 Tax=Stylosanthes scabra TaxID=79078 RepID=A0ABU6QL69_9FABA|nr:hypothetical protein [Stylosanthes scabra]